MADHRAAPHAAGVEIGVIGLGPDGGGIEQHLGAFQRHDPCTFGIPLVPADPHADARAEHVPHLEAVIPGPEIVLFLVTRPVGDMALAIGPHDFAVGPDHRQRVVIVVAVAFEETRRDRHFELRRELLHCLHARALERGIREVEQGLFFIAAEIFARKQLRRQDDLRALASSLLHQRGDGSDVIGRLGTGERQLQDGDGQFSHTRGDR